MKNKPKIGLALGSGSARGLSHIGVIRALERLNIFPDVVAGCSVGSLVGASYVTDRLDRLESWARSIDEYKLMDYMKLNFSSTGFVNAEKLKKLFEETIGLESLTFADIDRPFAAVAAEMSTGDEVWLQKGKVHEAIWASMAFPGLFPSMPYGDDWLLDGGLVNPVPVSLCRALGADVVIAVDLNADTLQLAQNAVVSDVVENDDFWTRARQSIKETFPWMRSLEKPQEPTATEMIANSIKIMQVKIARSRLAGDPPNILLAPRLSDMGLLDLYKADTAIAEGEACVQRMEHEILYRLGMSI